MGETKSLLDAVKEFLVKFLPAKLMKSAPKIKDDPEAAASLARVGELQIKIIRGEANLAAAIIRLQEKSGEELSPIRDELAKELTRLRDYGMAQGLLAEDAESQTQGLPTGRIAFYHSPLRVSVEKEPAVVDTLLALPADDPLRQLVVTPSPPPPPPSKLDRKKLLEHPELLDRLNELTGQAVTFVKTLFFAAFPTAQPDLREGMKIAGKVKEITVK